MQVINNFNLIGDSLYAIRPIEKFFSMGGQAALYVADNFGGDVCKRYFKDKEFVDVIPSGVEVVKLDCNKAFRTGKHISHAFSDILRVPWSGDRSIPDTWADSWEPDTSCTSIVIAPFSVSGELNKSITVPEFLAIVTELRNLRYVSPFILGTKNYEEPCDFLPLETASSLDHLIKIITDSALVITCDNGIAHLASAMGARTIVLWKNWVPERWIAPTWGCRTLLARTASEICKLVKFTLEV